MIQQLKRPSLEQLQVERKHDPNNPNVKRSLEYTVTADVSDLSCDRKSAYANTTMHAILRDVERSKIASGYTVTVDPRLYGEFKEVSRDLGEKSKHHEDLREGFGFYGLVYSKETLKAVPKEKKESTIIAHASLLGGGLFGGILGYMFGEGETAKVGFSLGTYLGSLFGYTSGTLFSYLGFVRPKTPLAGRSLDYKEFQDSVRVDIPLPSNEAIAVDSKDVQAPPKSDNPVKYNPQKKREKVKTQKAAPKKKGKRKWTTDENQGNPVEEKVPKQRENQTQLSGDALEDKNSSFDSDAANWVQEEDFKLAKRDKKKK